MVKDETREELGDGGSNLLLFVLVFNFRMFLPIAHFHFFGFI